MSTQTVKVSELVRDLSVYPRNCVFGGHVDDLAAAIEAGAVMPPVIACSRTRRLSDGFHRVEAVIKSKGADGEIEVQFVDYEDDAALFRDSMYRNSAHGRRLTAADIANCALIAERLQITREQLEGSLILTREKMDRIVATRMAYGQEGETVVVRRPMSHLAGERLTIPQQSAIKHVGGQTAMTYVNYLINLIETDSLPTDRKLAARLRALNEMLDGLLREEGVVA